jgi:hypothetical protein
MNEKVREVIAAYDAAHPHWRQEAREREVKEAEERAQRAQQAHEAMRRAKQQQTSNTSEQWWAAIDQRIRQHLEAEYKAFIDVTCEALSEFRFTLRKKFKEGLAELQRTFDEKLSALEQRIKSVPGRLPSVKVWRPEIVVYEGEIAIHEGSAYQALRDTAQTPGGSEWVIVARAGHDGRDAMTLNVRGTFDAYQTYKRLDIVACDGASFVATRDDPGLCPGENWQLLSRQGKPGRRGERGEPGPRGIPGKQGEAGAEIVAWKIERAAYRAIPLLSNGQEGAALDVREFFAQYLSETLGETSPTEISNSPRE